MEASSVTFPLLWLDALHTKQTQVEKDVNSTIKVTLKPKTNQKTNFFSFFSAFEVARPPSYKSLLTILSQVTPMRSSLRIIAKLVKGD